MLNDLVSVIETLQQRIKDHGATLQENEIRTRTALIDPLLTALGWDMSDPALVTPEYNVSGRWADYALLRPDGKPAATIEAKKLGESLASHRMQMLNYSNASGVEYAGLTDGDHWELYEVFQRGQLEDRRILDVSISSMLGHEVALKMLLLWRPNLASGRPVAAQKPIGVKRLEFEQAPAVESPISERTQTQPTTTDAHEDEPGWISLEHLDHAQHTPMEIRFPDGRQIPTGTCSNLLFHIAEWLAMNGYLTVSDVPVLSRNKASRSRGICIVNTEPKHPNGNNIRRARRIGDTSLVLNHTNKPRTAVSFAKTLLACCHIDPATVHFQVGK